MRHWYSIDNIDQLDTPALVVYPDRVQYNIDLLKTMVDDLSLVRPHVKTHKSLQVTQLMLAAGITKFKCATIAEAEMLGMAAAPDVLMAYQPAGPKIKRFIQLIKKYPKTKYSCLVDNSVSAKAISDAAVANNIRIEVFIDLNVGQNRTGIVPGFEAFQLYLDCDALPGVRPRGLHAYDGHIHEPNLRLRIKQCNDAFKPVEQLMQTLKERAYSDVTVIAGGSPTFPIHVQRKGVECSPGTFVYWDAGYQAAFKEQPFQTAVLVVGRVISLPAPGLICIDIGHKSIAAENVLDKRMVFLNEPSLQFVSQSEEHVVVTSPKGHKYKVGDIMYALPQHICPTVALYERIYTIENNRVAGEWPNIARDRKINI